MKRIDAFDWLIFLALIALAALLRLPNLESNPAWYTDEGTHLDIARNLIEGRVQYLAVTESVLLFARPPLFGWLLAGVMSITGVSMLALRGLVVFLSLLTVALIYIVLRHTSHHRAFAIVSALMMAIYPNAVLYGRFGFSYALLLPVVIIVFACMTRYGRTFDRRALVLAGGLLGFGLLSDLVAGSLMVAVIGVIILLRPRDLLWGVPVMFAPFAIYAGVMLITNTDVFLFDLRYTLGRLNTLTLPEQTANVALNFTTLLSQDVWMTLGFIGLFTLRDRVMRLSALALLLIPLVVLGRTVALHGLSYYYITPLLPVIALGLGALLTHGFGFVVAAIAELLPFIRWRFALARTFAFIIIATPLLTVTWLTFQNVQTRIPTVIDPFLINSDDTRRVADYVNARIMPDDVVIASPAVAWLIDANAADFQMSMAYMGEGTIHLPANMPRERFAFNADYRQASFVIVDNLWRNWASIHMPQIADMLTDLDANWQAVFVSGAITVYIP